MDQFNMQEKTYIESEEKFYSIFAMQFETAENAIDAWGIISKPTEYPCVVIKTCGKYIYVYKSDVNPIDSEPSKFKRDWAPLFDEGGFLHGLNRENYKPGIADHLL